MAKVLPYYAVTTQFLDVAQRSVMVPAEHVVARNDGSMRFSQLPQSEMESASMSAKRAVPRTRSVVSEAVVSKTVIAEAVISEAEAEAKSACVSTGACQQEDQKKQRGRN